MAMFDTSIHYAIYIFPLLVMAGYMGVGNMGTRGAEVPQFFVDLTVKGLRVGNRSYFYPHTSQTEH